MVSIVYNGRDDVLRSVLSISGKKFFLLSLVPVDTYPEELRARLMDGYYDDAVPLGEICQQHNDLIGCHAVQAGGRLIQ